MSTISEKKILTQELPLPSKLHKNLKLTPLDQKVAKIVNENKQKKPREQKTNNNKAFEPINQCPLPPFAPLFFLGHVPPHIY